MAHYLAGVNLRDGGDYQAAALELERAIAAGGTDPVIRIALSQTYLAMNDFDHADSTARAALSGGRRLGEIHRLLAGIALGRGRWEDGVRELEAARDAEPGDFGAHYQLGVLYHRAGQDSAARRELVTAASLAPAQPEIICDLASNLDALGDTTRARSLYDGALAADSTLVPAWAGLARLEGRAGNTTAALADLDHALLLAPDDYDLLRQSFRAQLRGLAPDADPAPVVAAGRRVLAVAPRDSDTALALAALLGSRSDYQGGREVLRALPADSPEAPAIHLLLGRLAWSLAQHDSARAEFEEAHRLAPDWPDPLAPLGIALLEDGEKERADSVLQAASAAAPTDAETAYLAGVAAIQMGHYEAAAADMKKSLSLHPGNERALFELGMSLERLGRFDDSVAAFKELLALDPKNALAQNYLGFMFADRSMRLDESQRLLEAAVAEEPDNGSFLDSLGWLYFRRGDLVRASDFLERAVKITDVAEIHAHLGEVYEKRGMAAQARAHWQRAVALAPANEEWRKRLEALPGE